MMRRGKPRNKGTITEKGLSEMIRGIGFDLCEIARMEKPAEDERFLNRFFTSEEAAYIRSKGRNKAQTMAAIFAAKEALTKALGTGIIFDLREIEVRHNEEGQPYYSLTGEAAEKAEGDRFLLSISHDGGMAGAVCICENTEGRI